MEFEGSSPSGVTTMSCVAAGGRKVQVEVESRINLIANSMTYKFNTNLCADIDGSLVSDPNRLTALKNNYLAELQIAVQRRPLLAFQRLRKESIGLATT